MLEVEYAFIDSLEQICVLIEEFLRFLIPKMNPTSQAGDFETSTPFCQLNPSKDEKSASSQVLFFKILTFKML